MVEKKNKLEKTFLSYKGKYHCTSLASLDTAALLHWIITSLPVWLN